jgi:hypothetical protein
MNYYKDLNRKINAKLKAEKAKRDKEEKLEAKRQKREQAAALKRMKRQGILEKERKDYAETRERRLKKLGMKVEKEKKGDSWIFHVDKSGYKGKGGLFKKKKPVTIKWGIKKSIPKKRSRKKKGGFWDKMRTL